MTDLREHALAGRPLDFPVIDAHAHVGRWANFEAVSLEAQVALMDRLGVATTIASGLLALSGAAGEGNDQVADAMRRFPGRFAGYVHVSACYPEQMAGELERCFALGGFVGVKVYQLGVPYDDERFEPAWRAAADRGAPVLAHTWGGEFTGLLKVARARREIAFLVAHAGSDFKYDAYIKAARRSPNIVLDLTYSREHTGMIEHIVGQIGPERVIWGTDSPLFSPAHQLGKVLMAPISDDAKRMILRENAIRLFRLAT